MWQGEMGSWVLKKLNKQVVSMSSRYRPQRRFLDMEPGLAMSPSDLNATIGSYTSEANFDNNMVIVLAALLCALICALGLNSIIRCVLRCGHRVGFRAAVVENSRPSLQDGGLQKSVLSRIPVIVYGSGTGSVVTDCSICLGEFVQGEKVRILPKCHHNFHVKCIDTWLMLHSSCPLCRQALLDQPPSCAVEEVNIRIRSPEIGGS